jgi:cell division transport system permease protein
VQHILHEAEQSVSVTVFFNKGTSTDQIDQLKIALEERPEVRQVDFVSADQAWEQFSQDFLGDYVDGFTDNPLEDMANLEIYLNDVSKQADLVDYLDNIDIVRKVNRSDITASTLTAGNNLIYYATMAIIGILFVVSIFLISNTVATGITSHKDEINIMKYIGATDFFVRAPYVFEGVIIGIIGSLIPLGLTYFIYNRVILLIQNRFSVIAKLVTFVPVESVFRYLAPIIIVLGVGIGFIGSAMTIRKHLHV